MRLTSLFVAMLMVLVIAAAPAQTRKAPNFSLKSADGKVIELAKLKGKTVVVNFWATWCGPCRHEIPFFSEVYKQYKDKGLEIVGISLDEEGWEVVTPFLKKTPIPYPVVVARPSMVKAWGQISAIPTTFLVDKSGNIVDQKVGGMSKEGFEAFIKPYIN